MTSLWVTMPGGHQVSSEDIFAVITQLERARAHLSDCVDTLISPGSHYRPEGFSDLVTSANQATEEATWLTDRLIEYTHEVAWQERWRIDTWGATRDTMITQGAQWLTGNTNSNGRNALADVDDGAYGFWRGLGGDVPVVTVTQVDQHYGVGISHGVAERIARIPDGSNPIRIERYDLGGGQWHTEVFVAGTRDWDVEVGTDPFDMRSNVALIAGVPAAAALATDRAMRAAGVTPRDRVVFVGHSQGGAVAAVLAESGRFDTRGLITVGAPLGTLPASGDYPALRIEHRDDIVSQLGGRMLAGNQTVVEANSEAWPFDLAGAHSRDRYFHTATRVDSSPMAHLSQWTAGFPDSLRGQARLFDARQSG